MHHRRFLLVPLAFLLFTFSSPVKASAQCGGDGQLACFPWVCDVWLFDVCLFGHYDLGNPSCAAGLEPILGFCQHCGAAGQFACPSRGCNTGLQNVAGFCVECGGEGQPPCNGSCDNDRYNQILGVCVSCGGDREFACQYGSPCNTSPRHTEIFGSCYLCGEAGQFMCGSEPHCANDRLNETAGFCVPCGGNLQPQCVSGGACNAGLIAVAGVCVPGECGGAYQVTCAEPAPLCNTGDRFNALPPIPGLGLCIPCGHDGLPVCLGDRPCDRFNAEAGGDWLGLCLPFDPEPEPGTNATATITPATSPDAEIIGFADIHTHMLANLGFGGLMVWGAPFDPDGITYALPWCDYTQDFAAVNPLGWGITPVPFLGVPVHGPGHALDLLGFGSGQPALLWNQGGSSQRVWGDLVGEGHYDGWPGWYSTDHQLMYHKWIERAYLGGQRLMVMLAVNNEVICELINRRSAYNPDGTRDTFTCTDEEAFKRQIDAVKEMEQYIDSLNGGTGRGWFRIAYSAQDARRIINEGKMAVIIGLEAATIFNSKGSDGDEPNIDAQLQKYYEMGARWVFPIHLWDNDFGGAAINQSASYLGNFVSDGHFFHIDECGPGRGDYGFQFTIYDEVFRIISLALGIVYPPTHTFDCNGNALTPLGVELMEKLMAKKMIIDIDHFSKKALDQALTIAERNNYPLMASHTRFYDVTHGQERAESAKTNEQLQKIRDLGGIVAPILAPVAGDQISGYGATVSNDCAGSSKQWAQQYVFAVDKMTGGPYRFPAVAFGSDFNAPIRHIAPRFGPDGCMGEEAGVHHQPQANGVEYPFEAYRVPGSQFFKQQTGSRQFDFNTDGLAHAGLLPDLIEDLRKSGVTPAQLEPLFHSAEAVVQMWERIDASTPAPSASYAVSPEPNTNGWNNTPVTVTITGTPAAGGTPILKVSYSVGGAAPIEVSGPTATVTIGTEGVTEVVFTVADAGHVTAPQMVPVRIDMTRPTALAERSQPPNEHGWHRGAVTISFTGSDALSGVGGCSAPVALAAEGAGQQASGTCTDLADNVSDRLVETVNIDLTPPLASASTTPSPNAAGWNNTAVTVSFSGTDALSGVFSCSANVGLSADGANQTASGTCEDNAGNVSAAAAIGGINIDQTAPVLTGSRSPAANANGWNNTAVAVTFVCSDATSGVSLGPVTPQTVSGEGAGQSRTARCTDTAGNTTTASVQNINIDLTGPVVSALAAPVPNAAGWNNGTVTVSFSGTDALSKVAGCTSNAALTQEGAGQSATGNCVDFAGNIASATASGINIDFTPPVMACSANPNVLWPPNHSLVPITNSVAVTDPLSAGGTFGLIAAVNSEPDARVADDVLGSDAAADIQGFELGTADIQGSVRAERNGNGPGRQYTFRYEGFDRAGNRAQCTITVVVPHDMY